MDAARDTMGQTVFQCAALAARCIHRTSQRTVCWTLPSTFSTILLRKFNHSNSWVSQSAMIFLGQTTFQSWSPRPATNWASCVIQSPSLVHLNSELNDKTVPQLDGAHPLPYGLAPLPHTLLRSMRWKPRPSGSLESSLSYIYNVELFLFLHFASDDSFCCTLSSPRSSSLRY